MSSIDLLKLPESRLTETVSQSLPDRFFARRTQSVAPELLGTLLCRRIGDDLRVGVITECEAYLGDQDRACHTYGGKRTPRTEIMYGEPGSAYIYLIYGLHHCLNVVTEQSDVAGAVLIRAIEPLIGFDAIAHKRFGLFYRQLSKRQIANLCNGPGKLCQAFEITREQNGIKLNQTSVWRFPSTCAEYSQIPSVQMHDELWLAPSPYPAHLFSNYERTPRIGIDYAGEDRNQLLRFVKKFRT